MRDRVRWWGGTSKRPRSGTKGRARSLAGSRSIGRRADRPGASEPHGQDAAQQSSKSGNVSKGD